VIAGATPLPQPAAVRDDLHDRFTFSRRECIGCVA
jgi:hypothetical protein